MPAGDNPQRHAAAPAASPGPPAALHCHPCLACGGGGGAGGRLVINFEEQPLVFSDLMRKEKKLRVDIANGRLAMVVILGVVFQDGLTGAAWGSWANYTDSPLRAFESELGVQDPGGFWDPLNFTVDGDASAFRSRRSVGLKHGGICMLAKMGYITPELTG